MLLSLLPITTQRKQLSDCFLKILPTWNPPPDITVREWADEYRFIPSESSARPGKWSTDRVPCLREIMDSFTDPDVEQVIFKKSAQVAGTEFLLNAIGYIAHINPAPILYLCPRETDGENFSKKRLAPTIRDTPVLRRSFSPEVSRTSGNTILYKKFIGGDLLIVGVNSPANLASHPICYVLSDEDDRQAESSGTEGDPWDLAWVRTKTYRHRRKGIRVSTPTLAATSRIIKAYDQSDRRQFHVPCFRCGGLHLLSWSNVLFDKDSKGEPIYESSRLQCPHCSGTFDNEERNIAIADPIAKWISRDNVPKIRGYELNQLYSPFSTIAEVVQEFWAARGNPAKMQVWVNTCLGEGYEGIGERVDFATLATRCEKYTAPVPSRALILTAGIDTQSDRLELEVVGWGAGEESWSIDYRVFHGDPTIPEGSPGSPWADLTDFLKTNYQHESGITLPIDYAFIDSGGTVSETSGLSYTQAVYSYVAKHRFSRAFPTRLFASKGANTPSAPVTSPAKNIRYGKQKSRRVRLVMVGVDQAKLVVVGRLKIEAPGPGYCHFPAGRSDEFFRQLASEKQVTKHERGKVKVVWVKTTERNEALDCRVYAYAAYLFANPDHQKLALRIKRRAEISFDARATTSRKHGVELPQLETTPSAQDEGGEILHDRITSTRQGRRTRTRDTRRRPAFRRDSW